VEDNARRARSPPAAQSVEFDAGDRDGRAPASSPGNRYNRCAIIVSGRLKEAEALRRQALAIDETIHEPDHPTIVRDRKLLASVLE
jgi:hypothetical protein